MKREAKRTALSRAEDAIAALALAYPGVVEHGPWGHRAFKTRNKTFLFLATEGGTLSFSLKLASTGADALQLPYAAPTGYGLGKSGWVTMQFTKAAEIPLPRLRAWIDESFRAIAPKRELAALGMTPTSDTPKTKKKKPSTKRKPAK